MRIRDRNEDDADQRKKEEDLDISPHTRYHDLLVLNKVLQKRFQRQSRASVKIDSLKIVVDRGKNLQRFSPFVHLEYVMLQCEKHDPKILIQVDSVAQVSISKLCRGAIDGSVVGDKNSARCIVS